MHKNLRLLRIATLIVVCNFVSVVSAEEDCLKATWENFNQVNYEKTIMAADICIDEFQKAAEKIQNKLKESKTPTPPIGKVPDPEKLRIFDRGLLNDVATALFLKGRSAEHLWKKGGTKKQKYKNISIKAYKETCKFPHARTWDPKGWFWSPCEAASNRLPL